MELDLFDGDIKLVKNVDYVITRFRLNLYDALIDNV